MNSIKIQRETGSRVTTRLICTTSALLLSFLTALATDTQKQPDQTYVLEGVPARIEIPSGLALPKAGLRAPTDLTQAQVESLLVELLQPKSATASKEPTGCASVLKPDTYYVLHLVRYEKGEPATRSDAWYAFSCGWNKPSWRQKMNDPEISAHYKQERLFGASKLSFLYLHYGVPSGPITQAGVEEAVAKEWKAALPTESSGEPAVDSRRLELFWDAFEKANPGIAWPAQRPTFSKETYEADGKKSVTEIERIAKEFSNVKKLTLPESLKDPEAGSQQLKQFWDEFEKENPRIAWTPRPNFSKDAYEAARKKSVAEIDRIAKDFAPGWVAEFRTNGARISGPRQKKLLPLAGPPSESVYYVEEDFLPITYKIDILKKNPVWQDDLRAIASQFGLQGGFSSISVGLP
jgi:hypothetical protein